MSNTGDMKDITLTLTLDEINLILEGLGQLSFLKVYALVAKIQQQAREQIERKPQSPEEDGI